MSDRLWKKTERHIAHALGGRRLGPGGDRADVRAGADDWLCCEIKERGELPQWLLDGLGQARRYAGPEQLPLLVLHAKGARFAEAVVCLRLSDFVQWFGPVAEAGDPAGDPDAGRADKP